MFHPLGPPLDNVTETEKSLVLYIQCNSLLMLVHTCYTKNNKTFSFCNHH